MTFKKKDHLTEDEDIDDDDDADADDIIVSNEVFKFTNPYKDSRIASRINFNDRTIAPRSVPIKPQVQAPQDSLAHPLKRKLLCTHSIKTKKVKEIIENDNDVIETTYYR